ncbi:hypothetical protein Pint_09527 [Pistacia integerrima]|uniref:Uncharacterized protein n=1 Tax=Pistacia integerrima TaxID=434235 RepID=A0ACC0XJK3_9ROSI|nr:hypothetical protein Pint_09527 [Pistacia integerrima]
MCGLPAVYVLKILECNLRLLAVVYLDKERLDLLLLMLIYDPSKHISAKKAMKPSKVDPMHLDYFSFSGRIIALALMHKVQVGVVFDRVFFLQLAGKYISLEDIRDADPRLYDSCKQILEMDAEFIDSDALGLTFVRDVEELGSRKIVELCPGGKCMAVNSKNREEYVNLLIRHQFVTSISEQATHFAKGFADILCNPRLQKFFFQSLELEDLDWMLFGSESAICVDDWKAHTEYNGYKETDPQIVWFWKVHACRILSS